MNDDTPSTRREAVHGFLSVAGHHCLSNLSSHVCICQSRQRTFRTVTYPVSTNIQVYGVSTVSVASRCECVCAVLPRPPYCMIDLSRSARYEHVSGRAAPSVLLGGLSVTRVPVAELTTMINPPPHNTRASGESIWLRSSFARATIERGLLLIDMFGMRFQTDDMSTTDRAPLIKVLTTLRQLEIRTIVSLVPGALNVKSFAQQGCQIQDCVTLHVNTHGHASTHFIG